MREKKKFLSLILMFGLFLGVFTLSWPYTASCAEVIQIKAANVHPMGHRLIKDAFELWSNEITKRTNGKVKFTWFHANTLVNMAQTYDGLQKGLTDVVTLATFMHPQYFPVTDLLHSPFIVDSSPHAADVAWEMYQTMPEMKKEYSQFKILGFFSTDVANFIFAKGPVVKKMEDLKNRKVLTTSPTGVAILRSLGATPQFIKNEDVYLSLQRGMGDGVLYPIAPARSWKLVELARYYTMADVGLGMWALAMRMETWQKLPPDVQKVFEELTPSAARLFAKTLDNEGNWVIEDLKKRGDEVYYLPPQERERWRQACKPIYDDWMKKAAAKGLNGQAILDKALTISEKWRKNPSPVDEWWKQGRMGLKEDK
jgi:TRAP-type transport system periplasmic protein